MLFFPNHLSYKTSALGRITCPLYISLVITSGQVKFLSPVVYLMVKNMLKLMGKKILKNCVYLDLYV